MTSIRVERACAHLDHGRSPGSQIGAPPSLPRPGAQWRHRGLLPGHSGGTASDSHRLPGFVMSSTLLRLGPTAPRRPGRVGGLPPWLRWRRGWSSPERTQGSGSRRSPQAWSPRSEPTVTTPPPPRSAPTSSIPGNTRSPPVDHPGTSMRGCAAATPVVNRAEGHATPTLLATFLHHHPGGDPTVVEAFAGACARHQASR